jgi:hypothetical protein
MVQYVLVVTKQFQNHQHEVRTTSHLRWPHKHVCNQLQVTKHQQTLVSLKKRQQIQFWGREEREMRVQCRPD